ncbi:MAG: regulator of sirC expression with transglutaminase-like and TPR domain [Glaciecola sp.]|jgi:regulator of sirC expression with transglutaminase-like and TPR domain
MAEDPVTLKRRERLARLVRDPKADLIEVALLISAEADPDLNVDLCMLKVDALADGLRTRGFPAHDPEAAAAALAGYLGGELGFQGDRVRYYDPANCLLPDVLARRRGMPIMLSVLYVGVARRLRAHAFPIALPGHVVVGVGSELPPVVLDAFEEGRRCSEQDLAQIVARASAGRTPFHRAMLRPAPTPAIAQRILENLGRDYRSASDAMGALWTVECKMLLPGARNDLHRERGDLLIALGRWHDGALALDDYLELHEDAEDFLEVQLRARRARARMN